MEKFCLQWNEFQNNLQTSYRSVRKSEDYSDVTLACGDGQQIEAHRIILSNSSNFFRELLKKNPHSHPLIYMRGISYIDLVSIVDFIYHGETEIMKDNLESFLAIAGELDVKGMTKQTKKFPKELTPNLFPKDYDSNEDLKASEISKDDLKNGKNNLSELIETNGSVSQENLTCDQCGRTLGTKASLKTHKYNHLKSKNSIDVKEEISGEDKGSSLDTMTGDDMELEAKLDALTEKRDGVWTCLQCGKYDNTRFHLRRHAETHIQGFIHKCSICTQSYTTRACLKSHIASKHPEEKPIKPYNCDICYKSSISRESLRIHKLRNHEGQQNEIIHSRIKTIEEAWTEPTKNLIREMKESPYI